MRKLVISWIESILLYMDRLDERRPGLKEITTRLAVRLVLFREKIDPYKLPESTINDADILLENIGQVHLTVISDSEFGLQFLAHGDASDYLEDRGGQGGGYSWEVLVKVMLRERKYIFDHLKFDPEADMLAIYSPDLELLRTIAEIINDLNDNRELLDKTISLAVERDVFE